MKALLFFLVFLLDPAPGFALTNSEIDSLLRWFERDPVAFMARDPSTNAVLSTRANQLIDPRALAAKNEARGRLLAASGLEAPAEKKEKLEDLLDPRDLKRSGGRILINPREMDAGGFHRSALVSEAWSGPSWQMYRGLTAQRYNSNTARRAPNWQEAYAFATAPGRTYLEVATGSSTTFKADDLSPAEKYDLFISAPTVQPQGILSRFEWSRGEEYQKQEGSVAKWFGYCHGWAPASFMLLRPSSVVTVRGVGGQTIRFYPSDIKALATALWANHPPRVRLIGTRCNIANPKRDENGRILDGQCLDSNPGTFHAAVVNQLGSGQRNLIIDATYDIQIWNQPIISYQYKYFNPQTKKAGSLESSVIARETFTKDKFAKYRTPNGRSIVGVAMELVYGLGSTPNHKESDSAQYDSTRQVSYLYDLELNDAGDIVGGEWYQVRHPDFIWTPAAGARAISEADRDLRGAWNPSRPLPVAWRALAERAAARGQPLAAVVETLISISRGGSN